MPTTVHLDDLDGTPHAAVFPGEEPKTVRLTLAAGEATPAHQHPDRKLVLSLRSGELELGLGGETHRVVAGDVVRFDGDQDISIRAVEGSTALLVMALTDR